jgi:hypothetical protein
VSKIAQDFRPANFGKSNRQLDSDSITRGCPGVDGWRGNYLAAELELGSGFIFFHFYRYKPREFCRKTFFSIPDKSMRWIALLTLTAFFMPRYSAIHDWDTVVFFHSKPASSTFHGSVI